MQVLRMWPCPEPGCSAWFTVVPPDPHSPVGSAAGSHHQYTAPHRHTSSHAHPSPFSSSWSGNKNPHENTAPWGFSGSPRSRAASHTGMETHSSRSATAALGLSQMPQTIRSGDSRGPAQGCWERPFTKDIEPLGHGRRSQRWQDAHGWQPPLGTTGRGPQAHPSPLGTRVWLKGHLSNPGACPLPSLSLYQGRRGRAWLGSSWLELAAFCIANRVISGASLPVPSQNTAMLGEALYSQRQTTHICFLTVGIAPTGTEQTGSLLSPSPCDCALCAEQCVANTILPGLSWALVDTWSVCPSPDPPKSPHASPARLQNVLPSSPASRSLQSCSTLRCLSQTPRGTQTTASAGGSSPHRGTRVGNQSCRRLRAAELLSQVTARPGARESSSQHGAGTKRRSAGTSREGAQATSQIGGLWRPPAHC